MCLWCIAIYPFPHTIQILHTWITIVFWIKPVFQRLFDWVLFRFLWNWRTGKQHQQPKEFDPLNAFIFTLGAKFVDFAWRDNLKEVLCFSITGKQVWARRSAQAATFRRGRSVVGRVVLRAVWWTVGASVDLCTSEFNEFFWFRALFSTFFIVLKKVDLCWRTSLSATVGYCQPFLLCEVCVCVCGE